jgi:ATP-binding cassette subfamily F protein uup
MSQKKVSYAAEKRQLKKDLTRIERQIEKAREKIAALKSKEEAASFDAARLIEIASELAATQAELAAREEEWLAITLALEGED